MLICIYYNKFSGFVKGGGETFHKKTGKKGCPVPVLRSEGGEKRTAELLLGRGFLQMILRSVFFKVLPGQILPACPQVPSFRETALSSSVFAFPGFGCGQSSGRNRRKTGAGERENGIPGTGFADFPVPSADAFPGADGTRKNRCLSQQLQSCSGPEGFSGPEWNQGRGSGVSAFTIRK